jgi:hypothetical protein
VNDQTPRFARIRHTATGAIAALVVVGAIAGGAALAAKPDAKAHRHAVSADSKTVACPGANGTPTKTPPPPDANGAPTKLKNGTPEPQASPQPFLDAIQRLVDNGTITAAEGQVVDREIVAGRVDTDTLAAAGFTQAQLDAVQQALGSVKAAMAASVHSSGSK